MHCRHTLDEHGFEIKPGILSDAECIAIGDSLSELKSDRAGSRLLLEQAWCRDLAESLKCHQDIAPALPASAVAVQCTLFGKSAEKNWIVAYHQDLSIPVREKVAAPGYSNWSIKEGVCFVQPSLAVLEKLVAVRMHLDDCNLDNGPLRVIPGSHRLGRLGGHDAAAQRRAQGGVACEVRRGAALLLRPLVLHASSKACATAPRRVLHFLFGPSALPGGVRWKYV